MATAYKGGFVPLLPPNGLSAFKLLVENLRSFSKNGQYQQKVNYHFLKLEICPFFICLHVDIKHTKCAIFVMIGPKFLLEKK